MIIMIIGYYHQAFFGGGNYYKLSKRDNEDEYKFEYCQQAVPNYIPNAEKYIKKYDTLTIDDSFHYKENFEGKIIEIYLEENQEIINILEIANNSNWESISKKEYTSDTFDDICWSFYIELNNKQKFFIDGYSIRPKEIDTIYNIFKDIKEKYIGKVKENKKDLEIRLGLSSTNKLAVLKDKNLKNEYNISDKDIKEFEKKYVNNKK